MFTVTAVCLSDLESIEGCISLLIRLEDEKKVRDRSISKLLERKELFAKLKDSRMRVSLLRSVSNRILILKMEIGDLEVKECQVQQALRILLS